MGVTFDDTEKKFVFDFEHDGAEDVVSLTGNGYQVEAFGKCFYYGYEFSELVDGSVRSSFIKYVKSTKDFQATPDLTKRISSRKLLIISTSILICSIMTWCFSLN